jgi:hypothetical protein
MSKIIGMWKHLLDDDVEDIHPRQWLGVYRVGADDPTFIVATLASPL